MPVASPEVLAKAARPGRMRDAALRAWTAARAAPRKSGALLRGSVRGNRSLHSRERRLVQEGLFTMVRRSRGLHALLGTDRPLALWLGWLTLEGLDPAVAAAELAGPSWEALATRWDGLGDGARPRERLALRHSVSDGLARQLVSSLGAQEAEAFLIASDARGPVTVRANRLRCTREELQHRLAREGVPTQSSGCAPDGLEVAGRHNLAALASFRDGWFEVQDEGSQRLAALVDPDGPVVDFCAGAGGKTLALAAHGVPVIALDVRRHALRELEKRAKRAGAQVETFAIAPQGPLPMAVAGLRASRVLVDAPCTGTGTLRRHPEHRWLLDRQAIRDRSRQQAGILSRAARLVAPGGRLIYGTCSVLRSENEAIVDAFLADHGDWALWGPPLRTAPHVDGADGFFGAVLAAPSGGAPESDLG